MSPRKSKLSIDLVIPVYNEEGVVEQTYMEVCSVIDTLPHKFTIYYIDDGSEDKTVESLNALAQKDKRVVVLELSRNFGHQAALTAGFDAAQGNFVISMDADGQHPPGLIVVFLQAGNVFRVLPVDQHHQRHTNGAWRG